MGPGSLKTSRILIASLIIIGAFFLFQNMAEAAVGINKQINFQGKVVNSDGTNVANGNYSFTFSLYTVSSGGSNVWTDTPTLTVTDGVFQYNLGSNGGAPLPGSVDFNSDNIYLGINFDSNGEMSPRVQFTAAPYAFQADKATSLIGGNDTTLLGSLPYQSSVNATSLLAPNTSATKNFLTMTGTGTNGAVPVWGTISSADVGLGNVTNNAQLVASTSSTQNGYFGDLYLYDDATPSNYLQITNSGNLTAPHLLNLNTNNVDRTISLSGDLTVSSAATISGTNNGDQFTNVTGLRLIGREDGAAGAAQEISLGTNLSMIGTTLNAAGGGGMTNPMTTIGDIIYGAASGTPARLAGAGTNGFVLKYNTGTNTPYWDTDLQGGAGGAWTDGTGITYLTDTAEDFAVGADNLVAPFSVDASTDTVRVGDGAGSNGKIDMYASDGDTGSITYTDNDTWAFEGGRVGVGTDSVIGATERLLQVGSLTNRGNAAVYGDLISKGMRDITALTNIKDIFVYDTSSDADGGRWIDWATTEKLSWYTESLDDSPSTACNPSTMDRCYKQAFPRKAIIIVTTDSLYIYDAVDNVMWMKFTQDNSASWALGVNGTSDPSSVTALNGVIYVGMNNGTDSGLYAFDFTQDRMWNYDDTDRSGADLGIGSRNSVITYNSDNNTNFDIATTGTATEWEAVNDVSAATIQMSATSITAPSAPRNGITFVALATNSGLTLINLSDQKILQFSETTADDYSSVVVSRTGHLYGLNVTETRAERWSNIDDLEVGAVNGNAAKFWNHASTPALSKVAPTVTVGAPDALEVVEKGSMALDSSDLIYVGTNQGLTEIHDNITQPLMGWSKFYNTTEQTALMPGTVRGAFMFSQAATPATDSSFRANSLAAKGGAGAVTFGLNGVRGTGAVFNGTAGYLCNDQANDGTCETDADYRVTTTAFNIQLWFKHSTTAPTAAQTLVDHTVTALSGYRIYMNTTGTITFGIDDDATTFPESVATSTQTYLDNQWHHLVAVRPNATGTTQLYIDGKYVASGATAACTGSLETGGTTAIFAVGATCGDATCSTGVANSFWNGSIDDVVLGMSGATTVDQLNATAANVNTQARRLYNDARPTLNKKVVSVVNATTATDSTIGHSAENWIPNEFAGQIVGLNGGLGSGQSRRIVSNTTNTLTVTPNFTTAPDATTDFSINSEKLYGATNTVTAIGITGEAAIGESRIMCAGTNDGSDGGGVSCYNHQAGPNIMAEIFHSEAGIYDDAATAWTGTNFDDIRSIDLTARSLVIGSEAHFYTEMQDVRLGHAFDYINNKLFDISSELLTDGVIAVGSIGREVGMTGGADLAEYYRSTEPLEAGTIVATGDAGVDTVKKTNGKYQKDVLGIVATAPGIILGTHEEDSYPVALAGRVPMNVTTENGMIVKGDQVTSSSLPGYGMVAIETGRVIGTVLENPDMETFADCPVDSGLSVDIKCGQAMVFVNLTDFTGVTMEDLMTKQSYDAALANPDFAELLSTMTKEEMLDSENNPVIKSEWTDIFKATSTLGFMKKINDPASGMRLDSEILAKNVNAAGSVVSPLIVTDTLIAKNIKAENIEGLQFIQTGIADAQSGVEQNTTQVKNIGEEINSLKAQLLVMTSAQSNTITTGAFKEMEAQGGLKVGGPAEFRGPAIFKALAQFIDKVVFKNDVEFAAQVMFNADAAGFAVIKEKSDSVEVRFSNEYTDIPVVNASLSLQQIEEKELRAATEQLLLLSDVKFIITNVTTKGFEIRISQAQIADVPFSWHAVVVKDAKTSEGEEVPSEDRTDKTDGDTETPVVSESPTNGNTIAEVVASPVKVEEVSATSGNPPSSVAVEEVE